MIPCVKRIIDPRGPPTVMAGIDHYFCTCRPFVRTSVRCHFSKQNKFQAKTMFAVARLWVWPSGLLMTPVLLLLIWPGPGGSIFSLWNASSFVVWICPSVNSLSHRCYHCQEGQKRKQNMPLKELLRISSWLWLRYDQTNWCDKRHKVDILVQVLVV